MSGHVSALEIVKQTRRQGSVYGDFINAARDTIFGASSSGTDAGVDYSTPTAVGRWGVGILSTGSTSTGRASHVASSGTNEKQAFGGNRIVFECDFTMPVLPASGDQFSFRAGFNDSNTRSGLVDGIFYEVDYSSGERHRLIFFSNSGETPVTLTGVPTTGRHILTLVIDATAANVYCYIDDVLVGSGSSGIPTGNSRLACASIGVEKTVGNTEVRIEIDWCAIAMGFGSAR